MARFLTYVIRQGDTVQAIAQASMGDTSKWVDIVTLNNLDHPFIGDRNEVYDPSLNLKYPGDSILLPLEGDLKESLIPNANFDEIYNKALGQDLAIFPDFPLHINGELQSNPKGDLDTVTGLKNLRQAILIKFGTPLGTLMYHAEFGTRLYDYLGKRGSRGTVQMVRVEIERTIRTDSRVQNVIINKCVLDHDTLSVDVLIQPIGYTAAFNMSLVFGKGGIMQWA